MPVYSSMIIGNTQKMVPENSQNPFVWLISLADCRLTTAKLELFSSFLTNVWIIKTMNSSFVFSLVLWTFGCEWCWQDDNLPNVDWRNVGFIRRCLHVWWKVSIWLAKTLSFFTNFLQNITLDCILLAYNLTKSIYKVV